ncbi:MAG: putative signal transducing protein [Bacteroidota bacterium]
MKLVKVKNFADRMTAEQAQQRLKEEGIECLIQSSTVGMLGSFGAVLPQGADIYVREEEAEKTRKILDDLFGNI